MLIRQIMNDTNYGYYDRVLVTRMSNQKAFDKYFFESDGPGQNRPLYYKHREVLWLHWQL